MQYIVVMSSRTEPLRDAYWIVNGVGRKGDFSLQHFSFLMTLQANSPLQSLNFENV